MGPGDPDEPAEGLVEGMKERAPSPTPPRSDSELLTFLFADIRGYTSFTQRQGDEAAERLTGKFAGIVRDLVESHGGTVFELRGDEAMCVFTSPRQSLRLAVALQQRFVEETAADAMLPMRVGIGIDIGEAVRGPDGYRGGTLNLAARLCSQAKAGDVLASHEVTHLARRIEGIRYVMQPEVALKGIDEPVRPVRVLPDGEDPAARLAALVAPSTAAGSVPTPASGLLSRLGRRSLIAVGVTSAVLVTVLLVVTSRDGGDRVPAGIPENSVGVLNPVDGRLSAAVSVQDHPTAAASGFGAVWTANTGANSVSRIDLTTQAVLANITVGAAPDAIAVGSGAVWVANGAVGTVSRIDPATNDIQTIPVGTAPAGITFANGWVWVTNSGDGTVSRIDPRQDKVVQTIEVGDNPTGIGGGSDVWVANSGSNTVSEVTAAGKGFAVSQTVHVGNDPEDVVVLGNDVWVTNNLDGTVARIPTTGSSVTNTVPVGSGPTHEVAVDGRLWVSTQTAQAVVEVDPATNTVVRTVHMGAIPSGVTSAAGRVWVTTTINPALHRGGTLRVAETASLGTTDDVDPVDSDSALTAWLLNGTYDGLVAFRRAAAPAGTAIVPDLATTIPEPDEGGRRYVFHLRSGVRWSTGDPVTVLDVRRGLQRAIAAGSSPLGAEIEGGSKCQPQKCTLRGVQVDRATGSVTITLVQPNTAFLVHLASGGAAAPAATPLGDQKTRPIPGTGPYRISRVQPGKMVELDRNPYFHAWSTAAQPDGFPDTIVMGVRHGLDTKGAVNDVAAGRFDWADARFAGPLASVEARFGSRVFVSPTLTTSGVMLNTRIPPFDNRSARRAVAFAVDRGAAAAHWFTTASVTCQVLPVDFPGRRPYCPYTLRPDNSGTLNAPDLATAQRLVDRSGTRGMHVTVWTLPGPAPAVQDLVDALRNLHYRTRLVVDPKPNYFQYIAGSQHGVQASFYGEVSSSPSAQEALEPLFLCRDFIPRSRLSSDPSGFCNHSIDRLMKQAERAQSRSQTTGNDLWAKVDRRITDAAPWVTLVNPSWADVVSQRIHNYERNPVLGVLFDQMWVR